MTITITPTEKKDHFELTVASGKEAFSEVIERSRLRNIIETLDNVI